MRNRSKYVPNEGYLCLAIQLEKCMMIFNLRIVPVRMKMTITQEMNNSEMSMQNIINFACLFFGRERDQKGSMRTKEHKKGLLPTHIIWMRTNKKNSYKCKGEFFRRPTAIC